jgi:hypothetical protein
MLLALVAKWFKVTADGTPVSTDVLCGFLVYLSLLSRLVGARQNALL